MANITQRICKVEGCAAKYYAKDYCRFHYEQNKKNNRGGVCSVDKCNQVIAIRGMCSAHYRRFLKEGGKRIEKETRYCSVNGCNKQYDSKGYCRNHYELFRRWGKNLTPPPRKTVEERLWSQVEAVSECLLWRGGKIAGGYGTIYVTDHLEYVHRVAYELTVGKIPEGLQLDHTCHTEDTACEGGKTCEHRLCCNPLHLEAITQQENLARGKGIAAKNSQKTHCPKGHPYSGDNLWITKDGSRKCMACIVAMHKKWRQKRRDAGLSYT